MKITDDYEKFVLKKSIFNRFLLFDHWNITNWSLYGLLNFCSEILPLVPEKIRKKTRGQNDPARYYFKSWTVDQKIITWKGNLFIDSISEIDICSHSWTKKKHIWPVSLMLSIFFCFSALEFAIHQFSGAKKPSFFKIKICCCLCFFFHL